MPVYDYGCKSCGDEFEESASVDDRYVPCWEPCSECGGEITILLGVPSIKFEGEGWTPKHYK